MKQNWVLGKGFNFNATPPASASQGQQKRERRRLARAWFVSARAFAAHMMSSGEQPAASSWCGC